MSTSCSSIRHGEVGADLQAARGDPRRDAAHGPPQATPAAPGADRCGLLHLGGWRSAANALGAPRAVVPWLRGPPDAEAGRDRPAADPVLLSAGGPGAGSIPGIGHHPRGGAAVGAPGDRDRSERVLLRAGGAAAPAGGARPGRLTARAVAPRCDRTVA